MAYTAVPAQDTGDPWTSTKHNTYIVDNFSASIPGAYTAKGDLLAASAANAGTVVTVGTNYSYLMALASETGGIIGQNMPSFGAWNDTSGKSYSSTAFTLVDNIDIELHDHASAYNGSRFTAPMTAYYAVVLSLIMYSDGGTTHNPENYGIDLALYKNGAEFSRLYAYVIQTGSVPGAGPYMPANVSDVVYLEEDDYIEMFARGEYDASNAGVGYGSNWYVFPIVL